MTARKHHWRVVRWRRVWCQYQRNKATVNAECACDHDGLKYMYTGSELLHQMEMVARKAQHSSTYLLARRFASSKPRKPYSAVPNAMAKRYGAEKPSAATCDPIARASITPACAISRNGPQRIAGPTVK